MQITLNQQNYIETIYDLAREHGHAHVKDIADRIGIRMASVTEAVRNLAELGLVNHKARRAVTLTEAGIAIATELEERHSILADFIHAVMGSSPERADELACKIEHVVDMPFMRRLSAFIEFLREHHPESIANFHSASAALLKPATPKKAPVTPKKASVKTPSPKTAKPKIKTPRA